MNFIEVWYDRGNWFESVSDTTNSFFEDVLCCRQLFDVPTPSREQVEKRTLPRALRRDKSSNGLLLNQDSKNLRTLPNYLLRLGGDGYSGRGKADRRGTALFLLAGYEKTYL